MLLLLNRGINLYSINFKVNFSKKLRMSNWKKKKKILSYSFDLSSSLLKYNSLLDLFILPINPIFHIFQLCYACNTRKNSHQINIITNKNYFKFIKWDLKRSRQNLERRNKIKKKKEEKKKYSRFRKIQDLRGIGWNFKIC